MEFYKKCEQRVGCDISSSHDIKNYECIDGSKGKAGINKNYTLEQVMFIAYNHIDKPNIITRKGVNSKWYLKKVPCNLIECEISNFMNPNDKSVRMQRKETYKYSQLFIMERKTDGSVEETYVSSNGETDVSNEETDVSNEETDVSNEETDVSNEGKMILQMGEKMIQMGEKMIQMGNV